MTGSSTKLQEPDLGDSKKPIIRFCKKPFSLRRARKAVAGRRTFVQGITDTFGHGSALGRGSGTMLTLAVLVVLSSQAVAFVPPSCRSSGCQLPTWLNGCQHRPMLRPALILQKSQRTPRLSVTMTAASSSTLPVKKWSLFGIFFLWQLAFYCMIFMLPITFAATILGRWDKQRKWASRMGNLWGRVAILLSGNSVTVVGKENLPPDDEPCMYLVNHSSYLDIPATAFLGRTMKYIGKEELARMPFIGWKMRLAKDIFIQRSSRASQAALLKATLKNLRAGNSVLAFPEGTISRDGTLKAFKRGPFVMAKSAKVRILPVTLQGTGAGSQPCWPRKAILPVRRMRLMVTIHKPLDPQDIEEDELISQTKAAIQSGLDHYS